MNFDSSASVTASTENAVKFFHAVKIILEKEFFYDLSKFISAITVKKYKYPNMCNTWCTLCKNMISLFILTLLNISPIFKNVFSRLVLSKLQK